MLLYLMTLGQPYPKYADNKLPGPSSSISQRPKHSSTLQSLQPLEWGTRNIVLSAGLGGMWPDIVIMGAYNLDEYLESQPLIKLQSGKSSGIENVPATKRLPSQTSIVREQRDFKAKKMQGLLPTDACKSEGAIGIQNYVTILEDLLLRLQINVAIAKGF